MAEKKLLHPIDRGDGTIVTKIILRRPKARDMVAIGDYLPILATLDGGDDKASQAEAAQKMSAKVFDAMVGVVAQLGDIDRDVALELDYADLVALAQEAFSLMGEA